MSTDFPENNSKQNIKKNYSEPHSPNTDSCASTNLYLAHRIHKRGETPHTRYLSSLKVIASYHILFLLTSRLINLIRILIFRTIEASVLYVIFHFHLCFWRKSWHIHMATDGPSYPQIVKGNSLFPPCGSGSLSCRTPDRFRHIW